MKENSQNEENQVTEETRETGGGNPGGAEGEPKKSGVKKEKKKTKEDMLSEELASVSERLLRVMAEYDNYRKRTDREKLQSASNGTANAVEKLLPVLDTLEMAAAAGTADAEYKKGVEMTVSLFRNALQALGVAEIAALGAPFDPNIHNCVASEASDGCESGTITRVLQKGYKLNDRVIRPSAVAVAE